ncbi:unnamed protein product [Cylicostephanus goldi]|uniref:Uncharacterized protein n=1 Tax=Cylicostephanus goldi TaxID=71465 RepID=A0A3P6SYS4_CYLGO|nr:unnamed protein product [Cylicostephanus goldi]
MFAAILEFSSAAVIGAQFQLHCSIKLSHRFSALVFLIEGSGVTDIVIGEAMKEARWDEPSSLNFELFSDDMQIKETESLKPYFIVKHNCEEVRKF